ncbi:MAG: beta-lactam-binding protein with PASTA domain/predicted Ser/Thr protein kinase [Acidimicrobiales bacterium]|jgi:eukaryotic-like serine/threonine-protein kinase
MADVFLAHDQLLDRPVAVKVLFPQFAAEPTFVERFRREAQAAANLNHPSIVAVYDWGEHDNTYFIVMEYVEGRSLAEIIRAEGTLHPDRAAEIAIDTAAALGFAHRNGVVHRDVKGGNILVSPTGQVKVTDFGIARAFGGGDELTQTGSVMGTATYFSPEQAQGKVVDPRSDLYSLGVVLFEMVTGRPPFIGDSPVAIAYKHVQEAPPRPSSLNPALPKKLETVIAHLLAKDPDKRYPSAEEVRADLRRFRENQQLVGVIGVIPAGAGLANTGSVAAVETSDVNRAVIDATRTLPATEAAQGDVLEEEYYEPPRRNGMFFAALAVLILVLGGLLFYIANVVGDQDSATDTTVVRAPVPAVIGETQEAAERLLTEAGFQADPVFEENADVEVGVVFDQNPTQGTEADEDSTVVIKVSKASETVTLPDVAGRTEDEATALLSGLGLRVDRQVESSDDVDEGIVISMSPQPNQEVNPDTLVTLTVSTGPAEVEVPQLAGLTVQEASNLLGQRGLPNPDIVLEPSSEIEKGLVIRSDPEAASAVSIDRRIVLYVSDGPETALVPPVVGLTQEAAEQAIINKGFLPVVEFIDVAAGSNDDGKVMSQDPAANVKLETGSEVIIRVGRAVEPPTTTSTTTDQTSTTESPTTETTVDDN